MHKDSKDNILLHYSTKKKNRNCGIKLKADIKYYYSLLCNMQINYAYLFIDKSAFDEK